MVDLYGVDLSPEVLGQWGECSIQVWRIKYIRKSLSYNGFLFQMNKWTPINCYRNIMENINNRHNGEFLNVTSGAVVNIYQLV